MTDQHPIIPPPELVQQWASEWMHLQSVNRDNFMADCAAQYGADQELEACIAFVRRGPWCSEKLRAARRPKPPSLKEQALQELEQLRGDANSMGMGFDAPAIRRALEQLDD
jgi:hypothetical protein